jgi:hypothetical protein
MEEISEQTDEYYKRNEEYATALGNMDAAMNGTD